MEHKAVLRMQLILNLYSLCFHNQSHLSQLETVFAHIQSSYELPTDKDFEEAIEELHQIFDTYKLDISDLVRGKIGQSKAFRALSCKFRVLEVKFTALVDGCYLLKRLRLTRSDT